MKPNTKPASARPVKVGGYSSATLHAKRRTRQREADDRQAAYESLTTNEKIDRMAGQRGLSSRQLRRLRKTN